MNDGEQSRKLFLGGLNYVTTEEKLSNFFGEYGKLVDCVVMRFPDTKRSRGFGFITFSSPEEADACFEAGPHTIDDKTIDMKRATPREDKEVSGPKGETLRKLFIGGLSCDTTDDGLRSYFEQFGDVVDCVVMKYKDTSRSRGFGFVTFSEVEMVDAVQQSRPHTIDGSKVETKRATPREESGRESGKSVKKVFVGGLKDDIGKEELEEYFTQFGHVLNAEHMTDKSTGRKRGFGFVEFDDYDAVDRILQLPRHSINGRKVDIKKAMAKDDMNASGGGMKGGGGYGRQGAGPSPWGGNQGGGYGGSGGYGGGNSYGNQGGFGGGFGGNQGGGFGGNSGGGWGGNQGGGQFGNPWQGGGGGGGQSAGGWGGNNQGNGWSFGGSSGGGGNSYMSGDNGWGGGYGTGNSGMSGRGGGAMRSSNMSGAGGRNAPYPTGGRGGGGGKFGGRPGNF